jgi:malonyl-CoA/methylmalonyl-CoA synthetase
MMTGVLKERGTARDRAAWQAHVPAGMDVDGVDLLAERSLPQAWCRRWREHSDALAIIDLGSERCITCGELDQWTVVCASLIRNQGVEHGDRVLFNAGTTSSLLLLYLAVLRLGAVAVPANTAYRERELQHIVRDCEPKLAIVDDAERASWVQHASKHGKNLPIIDPHSLESSTERSARCSLWPEEWLDNVDVDDLALICYTSGTTGAPKGAMLTHGNLLASAEMLRLAWRWSEEDGLVLALPLFHIHGLGVGVHGSLLAGGRLLLLPRFESEAVLAACARPDATLFFGVPTMYVRLLESIRASVTKATVLASLRLLVSGSAPLSPTVWEEMRTLTGQAILERYGMTETVMNISNPYQGERRPGTVGLPLPGVEVRISKDGHEAADSEVGEILVRGPNVSRGYWNRPEATAEVLDAGGWFHTGDLARRSSDGYISIVGRAKEMIITGGYNVYPREVEEVLGEHPAVREVAVVGLPSLEWGEEVVAFIVPMAADASPQEVELAAWCQARLASFKQPRRFVVIDCLPRNALGKVVKTALR